MSAIEVDVMDDQLVPTVPPPTQEGRLALVQVLEQDLSITAFPYKLLLGFLGHSPRQVDGVQEHKLAIREAIPVTITMNVEDGFFVAEASDLIEFGYGEDSREAILDLQQTLVELYFSLKESQDRLGENLRETWAKLQAHIEERVSPRA